MDVEKSEQTEANKKALRNSAVTVSYTESLTNYVKRYQLYIGMALASLGASYQIINAVKWGWWQPQGTIDYVKGLTQQQQFALDWGFLVIPLFIASFVVVIIGVALWFTDKR